jgi:hypothetical protein
MSIVEKDIIDNYFKVSLKDWMGKNRKVLYDEVLRIFEKHKRSDLDKWNYADFKRWVLSGENWTLDIQIDGKKYRTPLNLLCLFGMPKQKN